MSEGKHMWAGIDDGLQEKDEGSGAIYDAASGAFLFRVPPRYRPMIVKCVNAHESLVEACKFIKAYLDNLEDDGGYFDPLTEARQKFHAPLHAKLDAALALAEGKEQSNENHKQIG